MNIPESIPEDKIESYPCPNCEGGNVTSSNNKETWECDSCDFEYNGEGDDDETI